MSNKIILLSPPHLSEEGFEFQFVREAFESNWIAPLGPQVDAFEAEFAAYLGMKSAAALSSGTAALHLGLIILGVKPGDEVMCSSFTFSATANAITYTGAKPVFIDSERRTWNMDANLLEEALRSRAERNRLPKVVVTVDMCGQSVDYDPVSEVCARFGVPILEDAAEALGATYKGRKVGNFGVLSAFSFNGNKIITTSGGGMLVSDDGKITARTRFLSTQAREPAPHYQHISIGYNYRLSNILAAIGRGQLKVLDRRVQRRRWINEFYQRELADLPGVTWMPEPEGFMSTRWLNCLTIDPGKFGAGREDVRTALERENIECRPLWKPMHLQPVFQDCDFVGGSVSEALFENGLSLPSGSAMTEDDLHRICDVFRSCHRPAGVSIPLETLSHSEA